MIIKFNKDIYNKKAISGAIKEFKHLANFTIRQKKKAISVTIDKTEKEVKNILRDEFCNYVLYLMKK